MNMPKTLRLTEKEQELLRKKAVEINKILTRNGLEPLKDSELAHRLLDESLPFVKVDSSGAIYIEREPLHS